MTTPNPKTSEWYYKYQERYKKTKIYRLKKTKSFVFSLPVSQQDGCFPQIFKLNELITKFAYMKNKLPSKIIVEIYAGQ